jgi:hypothetical protein
MDGVAIKLRGLFYLARTHGVQLSTGEDDQRL